MGSTAWLWSISRLVAKEVIAQFVEPRAAYAEAVCCGSCIKAAGVKIVKNFANEFGWKTVDELFLFKTSRCLLGLPTTSLS
jgi:hypothetical protein